jgi:hypothetical protein
MTVYPIAEATAIRTTKKTKPRIPSSHELSARKEWNGFVSGVFRATWKTVSTAKLVLLIWRIRLFPMAANLP